MRRLPAAISFLERDIVHLGTFLTLLTKRMVHHEEEVNAKVRMSESSRRPCDMYVVHLVCTSAVRSSNATVVIYLYNSK